jgi:hypothetical protein
MTRSKLVKGEGMIFHDIDEARRAYENHMSNYKQKLK